MAAKVFVLAISISCAVGFELNCHMSRVNFFFDHHYSWVYDKCDRLIVNIGRLDNDGTYRADRLVSSDFLSTRTHNVNMKLYLAFELYPYELPKLGKKEYRDNVVTSVAELLMDRDIDGAVFDFDPALVGTASVDGITKSRIYRLIGDLKKSVGSQGKTIGLVAPVNGALSLKSPADCRSLDKVVDFIELSTHQVLINSGEKRLGHRSALGPLAGNTTQFNLETNIAHLVQSWLGRCEVMRSKVHLTVSPQGWGQMLKSSSRFGPLLEAGQYSYAFRFDQICKTKAERYSGWEGPVAIMDHPTTYQPDQFWVSFDDKTSLKAKIAFARDQRLAGISFNSLIDDDINGECDDGLLPLFYSVAEEIKPTANTTLSSPALDPSSASDKLGAICQAAAKVCQY
ncbi:Chitotriosidase-1 [Halotydeus destructor]|nr:Chitotriosidase-1 [Halotydeus destructor]